MNTLDQQHFKVTLLTPVHVGNGETLSRDLILQDSGPNARTFILDMENLLSRVTDAQADKITRHLVSQDKNLLASPFGVRD